MDSEKSVEKSNELKENTEKPSNKENEKDKVNEKEKPSTKLSPNPLNTDDKNVSGNTNLTPITSSEQQQKQQQQQPQQKQQKQQKQSQLPQVRRKRKGAPSGKTNQQSNKRRKRKREEGAPKLPLTGYVRYMNFRRDTVKQEHPEKTPVEHTKMIADEWNRMSEELKKPYLQAAEVDRERYNKQMTEFNKQKKAEASANNENSQQNTNTKSTNNSTASLPTGNSVPTVRQTTSATSNNGGLIPLAMQNGQGSLNHATTTTTITIKPQIRRPGDNGSIQIFTDEFLEHNKIADTELRTLRKSNIDYEQQNSVLEKHIESIKFGVEKMQTENTELIEKNLLLETYLQKLKMKLAQAFSGLSIPTEPNGATIDNIDKYMSDLYNMASSNSHGPASLNKAKDIIRKLDLQIQL